MRGIYMQSTWNQHFIDKHRFSWTLIPRVKRHCRRLWSRLRGVDQAARASPSQGLGPAPARGPARRARGRGGPRMSRLREPNRVQLAMAARVRPGRAGRWSGRSALQGSPAR